MPKTIIKVYFNNGCTTLIYNETTTVEDIIRVVIKGRLSLNELRYRRCFSIRATRFFQPQRNSEASSSNELAIIDSFQWLRYDMTIKEWLASLGDDLPNWKLQLRVRCLPLDLNEVKFKDPITYGYFYEQVKNDFIDLIAPELTDLDNVSILLDLGCLEMRRSFQNMSANILDKKINYEYLEKEVGLKRFFPDVVLKQKSKNIKKAIIKGLKVHENLKELECMTKYLEKLLTLWNYNEENYRCYSESSWGPILIVNVNSHTGIVCKMLNSKEIFKSASFDKILKISTEIEENKQGGFLKLKIVDSKELMIFKFDSLRDTENMATLVDTYCSIGKNVQTIWLKSANEPALSSPVVATAAVAVTATATPATTLANPSHHRQSDSDRKSGSSSRSSPPQKQKSNKNNSAHILLEPDESNAWNLSTLGSINSGVDATGANIDLNKLNKIPIESVTSHEKLGSGQFGDVYRGVYKKSNGQIMDVAIKKLQIYVNDNDMDTSEHDIIVKRFIYEAKIMQNFDHPHIIKLIGVVASTTFGIVMELAKFGQLRTYLQAHKDQIETSTLLLYCCQLSSAMTYLESMKYVHRDIAARNILVANHECIKLSDFGLSKEIDDIYFSSKCKMPIKWMAPESINFGKFTSQSDVWMFGVCIWEILSYGCKPFLGIKNSDVKKLIEDRQRLSKPDTCPDELYALMLSCWEYDSSLRPTFTQLKDSINSIYINYRDGVNMPDVAQPQATTTVMSKSLSNGSSFQSNSSISSTHSSSPHVHANGSSPAHADYTTPTITTTMKMMHLNASTTASAPPKPVRSQLNGSSPSKHARSPLTVNETATRPDRTRADSHEKDYLSRNNNAIIIDRKNINDGDNDPKHELPHLKMNKKFANFSNYHKQDELMKSAHKSLEEKFQTMGIYKSERSNTNKSATQHQQSATLAKVTCTRIDLILRDHTLKFIQSISTFIKYLDSNNKNNNHSMPSTDYYDKDIKLDKDVREIVASFRTYVQTVEASCEGVRASLKHDIEQQIEDMENALNVMISEFRLAKVERVVSLALEIARNANETFLNLTKSTNI